MGYAADLKLLKSLQDLRNGSVSPGDYADMLCERIDNADPAVHAMLPEEGRRDRLIREARILSEKFPDPQSRPALFGIPVGVKDIFRVDGFPARAGSLLPPELFAGKESSAVTKLKAAGALIAGKTVTTEFAFFEPGPTCNPYDLQRTPGGSSSGSAAGVACGFFPLALGTQTIGSITRPASYCGVFGFKPSFGRIPADGVIPFSVSADHVGFFVQDAEGIGIVASILCKGWNAAIKPPAGKPVLGIIEGKYLAQADEETLRFFAGRVGHLKKQGCEVIHINALEDIETINAMHRSMVAAECADVHKDWFAQYGELYRPKTRELILEGQRVRPEFLVTAKDERISLRTGIEKERIRNRIDLWLSPSSCTAPLQGLASTGSPLMNLPWTYMGMPTISVPSGINAIGLPMGLQFAAPFMQDELLADWICRIASQ